MYERCRTETYDYQMGTTMQLYLPWNMELYSDLSYFIREGYGYEGLARENYIWNCQLTKAFMKRNNSCFVLKSMIFSIRILPRYVRLLLRLSVMQIIMP